MATVTFTVTALDRTGVTTPAGTALTAGDTGKFSNNGRTFLRLRNTGGSIATVTIDTPSTVDGLAVAQRTVTVPITTGDKMIGPFPPSFYNDASDLVQITTDQPVSVDAISVG